MDSGWRFSWRVTVLATAAYYALAATAIVMTRLSGGIALIWFANGVLIPALCIQRTARWAPTIIGCFLASFAATLTFRWNPIGAMEFAFANVLEGVLAAAVLRWAGICKDPLADLKSVLGFVAIAGLAVPMTAGVFGMVAAHTTYGLPMGPTWRDWVAGHGLGAVITGPFVMMFPAHRLIRGSDVRTAARQVVPSRARDLVTAAGLYVTVAFIAFGVFAYARLPLLFLPALPMMIAAFVIGRTGATGSLMLIAVVAGFTTANGHGPIAAIDAPAAFRFQFLQFYLATLLMMALPAAAVLNQRRRLFARLQESEQVLRHVTAHSTDILLNADRRGLIRYASPSIERAGGYDPVALVGRPATDLILPDDHSAMTAAHLEAMNAPGQTVTIEYRARLADGGIDWFESNICAMLDDQGQVTGTVSAIRNVDHRKRIEESLRTAAETDPLTGLTNRRGFDAALRVAARPGTGGPGAMLAVFDIDHFKRINDEHGHAGGDAVLVALAELLRATVRRGDISARIGGEEFALLFHDTDLAEAAALAERLRHAIANQPILVPGAQGLVRITASFGLASVLPGVRPASVLATADRALYAAKHGGRNRLNIAA